MAEGEMKAKGRILKEGPVHKRSSVFKQWRHRFLILSRETLCVFKKEEDEKKGRTAEGRIFVMDIASLDKYNSKKKKFSFYVVAEGRTYYFCCVSDIDRELWLRAIKTAQVAEFKEEENDPIRRKSMKLTGGLKRITIEREKGRGLGCTIKSIGGVIFVNRILEDGAVSRSGILRPGDQLLDINGIELAGRTVAEVSEIIRSSSERVICTVKPATDFRVVDTHDAPHTDYAELDLTALKLRHDSEGASSGSEGHPEDSARTLDLNLPGAKTGSISSSELCGGTPEKGTPVEKEDPDYDDVIPSGERRHSLPPRPPPREPIGRRGKDDDLNYLELDFAVERPRVHSDGPPRPAKKPVSQPVTQEPKPVTPEKKHEIPAYAYIELNFDERKGDDLKPSTLPKPNRNPIDDKRKSATLTK